MMPVEEPMSRSVREPRSTPKKSCRTATIVLAFLSRNSAEYTACGKIREKSCWSGLAPRPRWLEGIAIKRLKNDSPAPGKRKEKLKAERQGMLRSLHAKSLLRYHWH